MIQSISAIPALILLANPLKWIRDFVLTALSGAALVWLLAKEQEAGLIQYGIGAIVVSVFFANHVNALFQRNPRERKLWRKLMGRNVFVDSWDYLMTDYHVKMYAWRLSR